MFIKCYLNSLLLPESLPSSLCLILLFSTLMNVVITVMFCLHLQQRGAAVTAEQDVDAPSALMLHSLSLKPRLGRGRAGWRSMSCSATTDTEI